MERRQFLATAASITFAGCAASNNRDDNGVEAKATKTSTTILTDEERASTAAERGLENTGSWSEGVQEIDSTVLVDGGYTLNVRYNLDYSTLSGEFTAEKAEKRAGFTARNVIKAIANSEATDVKKIALFAYVPTTNGDDTVSTKIVINIDVARNIKWESFSWQELRTVAGQYKFNSYLYS